MIIPLAETTVLNWEQYLVSAKALLGRSLTKEIDACGLDLTRQAELIATLSKGDLRDAGTALRHVSYTFLVPLVSTALLLEVYEHTDLSVTEFPDSNATRLLVVTGTLETWRNAMINAKTYALLKLLNEIMQYFDTQGLGIFFQNYRRVVREDTAIVLVEKKR